MIRTRLFHVFVCMLHIYQAASVDATALGAFSHLVLSFGLPLACLQTRLHPWNQRQSEKKLKLQLIMLTWKSVTRRWWREDDKACVCFITTSWKISSIGKAAVVDRERCPQPDGVNDANLVLRISSLSRIGASSFFLSFSWGFTESKLWLSDRQDPGGFFSKLEEKLDLHP